MFLGKVPVINRLQRKNKIIYGAAGLAVTGIIIILASGFYGSGFAIVNLLSAAALAGYLYLKEMKEQIKRHIPVAAGAVSAIIGIVTFLNTFYLYSYSAGTSLFIQIVVLISIALSIIVLDEGIDIYKSKPEIITPVEGGDTGAGE